MNNITIDSFPCMLTKLWDIEGTSMATLDVIPAGESATAEIKYKAQPLPLSLRIIFLPVLWFISDLAAYIYRFTEWDYKQKVKIGWFNYSFGFEVLYEEAEANKLYYDLCGVTVDGYPSYQSVQSGKLSIEPTDPENDEYIFLGWYTSKEYDDPYYFNCTLSEDTVIYAKWKETEEDESVLFAEYDEYWDLKDGEVSVQIDDASALNKAKVSYSLKTGCGTVSIEESTDGRITNTVGIVGVPISILLLGNDELESARISFCYDESKLSGVDETKLGIIWYDEANEKLVLLENVVVDTEANEVYVDTDHFSKYVLVDTDAWLKAWEHKQLVSRDTGKSLRYNIVMCLDCSGSMRGTPISTCQSAARNFVDQLVEGDQIAVVGFTDSASTLVSATKVTESNKSSIKSKINLSANGGTDFDNALSRAVSILNSMPDASSDNEIYKKYIVFVSDGQDSVSSSMLSTLKGSGYTVMAIGVGDSVSESELKKMANNTSGGYAHVSNPGDIGEVFTQMQGEFIGLIKDSDGDGIADLVETTGMIGSNGYIYHTDPDDSDTDGDGLSDGEEMGVYDDVKGYFIINSSPTTPTFDSDKAGITISVNQLPNRVNSTNIDDYKQIKFSITITNQKREIAKDLLSEEKFTTAENVEVKVKTSYGSTASFELGNINPGENFTDTITVNVTEEKNLKGTLEVTVSGSNFDSKTTETQYDVFSDFCNAIDAVVAKKETEIAKKTTDAVRACLSVEGKSEEALEKVIMLNDATITSNNSHRKMNEKIMAELEPKLAKKYIDKAKEFANKNGWFGKMYDGEDVVNECAKMYKNEKTVATFTIDEITFTAKYDDHSVGGAGFGTIEVTWSNNHLPSYFTYSSTPSAVISAINVFMEECRLLSETAINKCMEEVKKDTTKLLGLDMLDNLFKAKCGDVFDKLLSKAGISSYKYNDLKKWYDYYKKAKSALDSCKKLENPTASKINSAMKSVNNLLNYSF
ncbi:MAG: VWA domain-containing protein [Clostridia bacterium]|nr:VWA domain-containing protein [Clostridia bacterium]